MLSCTNAEVVLLALIIIIQPILSAWLSFGQVPFITTHSSLGDSSSPRSMIDNSVNGPSLYYSSSTHLVYSAYSNITKSDYTINYDNRTDNGKSSNDRVVIINLDDSYKSQYTYAKPILDKYGFKATFFVVCNWIGSSEIGEN